MRLVFISDTHNKHDSIYIPKCDILFHTGDATFQGKEWEVVDFAKWLNKQPAKEIVFVPGNHELVLERCLPDSVQWVKEHCPRAHVLIEESVTLKGLKIYGSPITPWFFDWAWNRHRGNEIAPHWEKIPIDTDILLTHGPPYGQRDRLVNGGYVGCNDLLNKIEIVKPKIHAFGHIHYSYGISEQNGTNFINASICAENYLPENKPVIVTTKRGKVTKIYHGR